MVTSKGKAWIGAATDFMSKDRGSSNSTNRKSILCKEVAANPCVLCVSLRKIT